MKIKSTLILFALMLLLGCNSSTEITNNPFQPGKIWKDNNGVHINAHGGGILYHKNQYYWYGEHRSVGEEGGRAQVGVRVYTSKNLYDWTDEGVALEVNATDPASDIAKGCVMERPKVIYNPKTKKFVMWFHLELKGQGYLTARTGVAVSDKPEGPFTFLKSIRPNAGHWPVNVQDFHKLPVKESVKEHYCGGLGCLPAHVDSVNLLGRDFQKGQMARDMSLFVDDDGKAYHIYSSEENSTTHISELTDDFLSYSGNYVRVFTNRYMEAPAILKTSQGKYFFIASDCTGWKPNAARSAKADNIFGPWEELGNPCIGADSALTFNSQPTYLLPVAGKKDAFIYMGDRWDPNNLIDSKYIWLPVKFNKGKILLEWRDQWDLNVFNSKKNIIE